MAGTLISFAGFVAQSCVFRRSRGFGPDTSEVVFWVDSFPDGFEFAAAPAGKLTATVERSVPTLEAIRALKPGSQPRAATQRNRLPHAGTLVMAEVQARDWQVVVHPLYVKRIATVRKSEGGRAKVRVVLVDERELHRVNGFLRRWSFNRSRGDGTSAPDSVKAGGGAFNLAEIAAEVVSALPRTPALARAPESWAKRTGALELAPYSPALSALAELVREGNCLDPCLRLDGTVALHELGNGFVGYAEGGAGANSQAFPDSVKVSLGGTGQGHAIEAGMPPDFVVVRGGPRVETVADDDAEPVFLLGDQEARRVLPLTEENVLALTEGAWGLEGLKRFVMAPQALQSAANLKPEVAQLFREQAWVFYRPRDVEVEVEEGGGAGRAPLQAGGAPAGQAPAGRTTRPGPKAHVLPLLPRAEMQGGRRMPVSAESARWQMQHRTLDGSKEQDALTSVRAQRNSIRERVEQLARARGGSLSLPDSIGAASDPLTPAELLGDLADALPAGLGYDTFSDYVEQLRLADRIKELSGAEGSAYENTLRQEAQAADAINGTAREETLAIARKALDFERDLRAASNPRFSAADLVGSDRDTVRGRLRDDVGRALQAGFKDRIAEDLRAISRKISDKQTQQRLANSLGLTRGDFLKPISIQFVRNLPRQPDRGATLVSAELGVVRLSQRAVHLTPEGAPGPDACVANPQPVRLLYGTHVRPRTDQALQAGTTQPRDGVPPPPGAAGDAKSWFARAFRRAADGSAGQLPTIDSVPPGEGLVIPREDLVELVPLTGSGNVQALETTATELARDAFRRPEKVQEATHTLARPWPVNCDGVVASVEIRSRDTPAFGTGFLTIVTTGGEAAPESNPFRTVVRPPRQREKSDGKRREGLT